MSLCFATGVTVNDRLVSPVPENWTMEEAITVLSTYSTVWYGLIKRANLMKGMVSHRLMGILIIIMNQ
jgi:NADPH:quinone reductase-like Zn-dependent oxidoreductase